MRRVLVIVLVLNGLCHGISAFQQSSQKPDDLNSGIVYGRDHSFILSAPNGWILDNSSGVSQGLHAVFFPDGSSWKGGTVVMYARVIHKDAKRNKTIGQVIQNDIVTFKNASNDSTITDGVPISTKDSKKAVVKYFYDGENKNHEAVAFIDESKVVVILVLTSRAKEEYEKSLSAFKDLIASYHFLAKKFNRRD